MEASEALCKVPAPRATSPSDALHHVVFAPGCKDHIRRNKSDWLELNVAFALLILKHHPNTTLTTFAGALKYPDHRGDLLGVKQFLVLDPKFLSHLEHAPTCHPVLLDDTPDFLLAHGSRRKSCEDINSGPVGIQDLKRLVQSRNSMACAFLLKTGWRSEKRQHNIAIQPQRTTDHSVRYRGSHNLFPSCCECDRLKVRKIKVCTSTFAHA